uniref:Monooxygenase D n=1 Tax=Starmerella bombicola TaxID=75736 RepID=A0A0A7RD61_STABO|nr:monooxygenase D [Starmerella bombicola]
MIPETSDLMQLHSLYYKSPSQLPKGNVLVVGAGSSGAQIAEELSLVGDGRKIFLSVGGHNRPPRSYRGRDFCWWLGVLNEWDDEATENNKHVTIAVSGARGGQTMDFRRLAAQGITLLGHADGFAGGKVLISNDLRENIRRGDENYLSVLDQADEFIARNGLDLPEEPEARDFLPDPSCLVDPVLELDLEANGITSIIWATGFRNDYSWISSTKALGSAKKPSHRRGVSDEPGIYFLGLPWQTRRGSSFIWGVWHDAKHVADHIAKQRGYAMYRPGVVKN